MTPQLLDHLPFWKLELRRGFVRSATSTGIVMRAAIEALFADPVEPGLGVPGPVLGILGGIDRLRR